MTWILTVGIRWVTVTEILRESMGFYQMMLQLLDFTLHRLRAKLQFPSFTLGMVRGELSLTVFVQCGPVEDLAMEEYQRLKKNNISEQYSKPLLVDDYRPDDYRRLYYISSTLMYIGDYHCPFWESLLINQYI